MGIIPKFSLAAHGSRPFNGFSDLVLVVIAPRVEPGHESRVAFAGDDLAGVVDGECHALCCEMGDDALDDDVLFPVRMVAAGVGLSGLGIVLAEPRPCCPKFFPQRREEVFRERADESAARMEDAAEKGVPLAGEEGRNHALVGEQEGVKPCGAVRQEGVDEGPVGHGDPREADDGGIGVGEKPEKGRLGLDDEVHRQGVESRVLGNQAVGCERFVPQLLQRGPCADEVLGGFRRGDRAHEVDAGGDDAAAFGGREKPAEVSAGIHRLFLHVTFNRDKGPCSIDDLSRA